MFTNFFQVFVQEEQSANIHIIQPRLRFAKTTSEEDAMVTVLYLMNLTNLMFHYAIFSQGEGVRILNVCFYMLSLS